jgi:hypothetical protein
MCKKYRTYESLEGQVKKVIKKTIRATKGIELAAAMIAAEILAIAKEGNRPIDDKDISRGIFEHYGNAR